MVISSQSFNILYSVRTGRKCIVHNTPKKVQSKMYTKKKVEKPFTFCNAVARFQNTSVYECCEIYTKVYFLTF